MFEILIFSLFSIVSFHRDRLPLYPLFIKVSQMDPYKEFVKLMLPVEVRETFELVKVDVVTYPSDTKTDALG